MQRLRPVVALFLLLAASNISAQGRQIKETLNEMKASTDTAKIESLGRDIAGYEPKSKQDVESLLDAMEDAGVAPYAQQAVARAKDPALGPALHEGLKSLKAGLRHMPDQEFRKMSREEQGKAMARAMNIAALAFALGQMKHRPATDDLRELLSYDQEFEGYISFAASRALGDMGDEETLARLMKRAGQGKPVTLSGYGTRGIRKIVEKIDNIDATFKANPKKPNDSREMEITQLSAQIRQMSKKTPERKEVLRQLLQHPRRELRDDASQALMLSLTPKDKDVTLEMLRNKDVIVRGDGLMSLRVAKTWDKSFLPVVIDMIQHDPDQGVRRMAIDELLALVGEGVRRKELQEAVPYLKAALQDKHLAFGAFEALRAITGRFYPYKGIWEEQEKQMQMGPEFLPENESKHFNNE